MHGLVSTCHASACVARDDGRVRLWHRRWFFNERQRTGVPRRIRTSKRTHTNINVYSYFIHILRAACTLGVGNNEIRSKIVGLDDTHGACRTDPRRTLRQSARTFSCVRACYTRIFLKFVRRVSDAFVPEKETRYENEFNIERQRGRRTPTGTIDVFKRRKRQDSSDETNTGQRN